MREFECTSCGVTFSKYKVTEETICPVCGAKQDLKKKKVYKKWSQVKNNRINKKWSAKHITSKDDDQDDELSDFDNDWFNSWPYR